MSRRRGTRKSWAAPGDVLVATIAVGGAHQTLSAPGWTLIRTTTPGAALQRYSYYRVVGAAEPGAYVITAPDAKSDLVAAVAAYSGVDTQAPIAAVTDATGAQAAAIPPVATTAPAQTVVGALSLGSTATVTFDPTVTSRVTEALGKGHVEIADFVQPTTGATDAKPATTSGRAGERGAQAIVLGTAASTEGDTEAPASTAGGSSTDPGGVANVLPPVTLTGPSTLPLSRTGVVPVPVTCTVTLGDCAGTLEILDATARASKAQPELAAARRRKVLRRTLGRRKFIVRAGAGKNIPVRLTRRGRRIVINRRKRKTKAKITTKALDGTFVTTTKTIWIKAPPERRTPRRGASRRR